jgi:dTMP kinase
MSRYIAFEGIDGSGTSSVSMRVAQILEARGSHCLLVREPTNGPVGVLIRQILRGEIKCDEETFSILWTADRVWQYNETIYPFLNKGGIVLSDRCVLSTFCYQSLNVDSDILWDRCGKVVWPEFILYLDIDPEIAMRRIKDREVIELYEKLAIQRKVVENYRDLRFSTFTPSKIVTIDASQEFEAVVNECMRCISEF